ncbi:MAG: BtrH N-terminal domain-containing protein [Microbacteriaceae bacterium]
MNDSNTLRATGGTIVVDGVTTAGGVHCETTALGVLLSHAGLPLSEPMLFGLGSGLSFIYWDSKKQALPFLGGRVKPFSITANISQRLGMTLRVQETASPHKAWEQVRTSIDRGIPVGLQLDSYDLEYFTSPVHFAGHVVAMYGYDEHTAYLVDTKQQGGGVSTSIESLARARAARGPMSARHRSFTLEVPTARILEHEHHVECAVEAIISCADEFLTPPIANVGHRGIHTAATRILSWFDRVADPHRDLAVIAMLMERAGTGGALFRNLYRDFLDECQTLLGDDSRADRVEEGKELFAEAAVLWTEVATLIEKAGATGDRDSLVQASHLLKRIAVIETSAMTILRSLGA